MNKKQSAMDDFIDDCFLARENICVFENNKLNLSIQDLVDPEDYKNDQIAA